MRRKSIGEVRRHGQIEGEKTLFRAKGNEKGTENRLSSDRPGWPTHGRDIVLGGGEGKEQGARRRTSVMEGATSGLGGGGGRLISTSRSRLSRGGRARVVQKNLGEGPGGGEQKGGARREVCLERKGRE